MISLIPLHDENPTSRRPVVTWLLIAINVIVFVLTPLAFSGLGGGSSTRAFCEEQAFFLRWAAIPDEVVDNQPLLEPGDRARVGPCVITANYDKSPVLSVLTAMFLHGGWLHLLGNMLFLFVFGNNVEDRLGHVRYLLFYLVCGYVATYAFALSQPDAVVPLVGASGAIAGVLGAYLILFPRARVLSLAPVPLLLIPLRLPAWVVLGSWFLLQWLYATGTGLSDAGGVAYLAHVAGFVAGLVGVFAFGGTRRRPPPDPQPWPPPTYYR